MSFPSAFALLLCALGLQSSCVCADEALQNRGHDPFFQISSAIGNCPEPLGPRVSEAEWKGESHHRVEHGSDCWLEGRCRLPSAFEYDDEIAESTRRRLQWLSSSLPAWQHSTLWVTVYERWIVVQGCVAPDFPSRAFLSALREVPDVLQVSDETTANPKRTIPYRLFRR
ncbi:BON domain-containing protein [Caballeronia ptereochthonis]|uniref:BON domain protein n=1 Tax=Caballeronia ptereochthonis TaxID=1777144 RepID=A0A158AW68_9BURK|nr:hypothetical protein AWB83_02469 [Caballeronia ptereochthonis]